MGSALTFFMRYAQEGEFLDSIVTEIDATVTAMAPYAFPYDGTVTAMAPYAFPYDATVTAMAPYAFPYDGTVTAMAPYAFPYDGTHLAFGGTLVRRCNFKHVLLKPSRLYHCQTGTAQGKGSRSTAVLSH
jgi:hypothetical protein